MEDKKLELSNSINEGPQNGKIINIQDISRIIDRIDRNIDYSKLGIFQWYSDNRILSVNQSFLMIFGLKKNATFLEIHHRAIDLCFAEDLIRIQDALFALESGKLNQIVMTFRLKRQNETISYKGLFQKMPCPDDNQLYVYSVACWYITNIQNKLIGSQMKNESVREQKNSNMKGTQNIEHQIMSVRSQISYLHDVLLKTNSDIWSWNIPHSLVAIEMPSLEALNNVSHTYSIDKIIEKIHPEDINKINLDWNNEKYAFDHVFSLDLRLNYSGHAYNWFEFRGVICERDRNGLPVMLKGIFFNIDERKKKESDLQKQLADSSLKEKNRDTFFSNLSHEIRTPLQVIIGFCNLLIKNNQSESNNKYLDIIKTNQDILLKALDGLESHPNSPDIEPAKRNQVAIWEYMADLQQIYSMRISKPVKLIFPNSYDSSHIIVDKECLSQILDAFLLNAIKYTSSGSITYKYEYKENSIIISVTDTGIGIQPHVLDSLFSSFQYYSSEEQNTGITLSMCRSLAVRMKGSLSVNSYPGEGSCFTLEIPLEFVSTEKRDISAQPVALQSDMAKIDSELISDFESVSEDIERPVVLVAEDVISSFLMLKTLLEDRFEVIHAENGAQAVDLFKQMNPVLIFMDIKMPVMDGIEASRQIRKISSDVPIVVLTAYAVRSLRKEASEAGCTEILTKPTTSRQIHSIIRKYVK